MNNLFDVFISYGRADSKDFAAELNQKLIDQGLNVWFDQDDIPLAVDYQIQIDRGIEKAHNFIFIISPHAVNSPYCLKEIKLAVKHHKHIIPLLHVEQISQATWQERNPHQPLEKWSEYQAKGLHSSYPNMHPTISKINWIYCRENIDNLTTSFSGLITTIQRHQVYLEQHTRFLVNALKWTRNQKQTNYLLTGEEKNEAKAWLKHEFIEEQPPCIPTDLHCEFISESIKNANNLMTEVFLCAANYDNAVKQKIAAALMRQGLTIWTNQTDLRTGIAFQKEINKGIEGADTFIYLISPQTLRSQYCQQELAYALAHHKYIIPLLIKETDLQLIPPKLLELQFIDLTGTEVQYAVGIDKLLKALKTDSYYFTNHKLLLVKALKWERQNYNSSILLRSYNLQHFVDWLKIAQQRQDYPPLPLQEKFIKESLQQPPPSSWEVFISYSRANSHFARQLNDALTEVGKLTWFDQESIASGTNFQQEIYQGIENCDNFVFIISPQSVASPYCFDEVEYAFKLHKRIIPVVYQPVPSQDLHPVLAKTQWIDFNQQEQDFNANFPKLVRTIHTDREHVHNHTKWSQRAREWLQRDKDPDLLLRGSEFLLAQNWLDSTLEDKKQPLATNLQQEFIASSQKEIQIEAETEKQQQAEILRLQQERTQEAEARLADEQKYARRQKLFAGISTLGFMITTALGLAALFEYQKSKVSQINAMSLSSQALFANDKKLDALIEAIKAKRQLEKLPFTVGNKTHNAVKQGLQQAIYSIKEHNRLSGHYGAVLGVAFSPDNQLIASGSSDNTIILWKRDGSSPKVLRGHQGSVNAVTFSPDSQLIASASVDNTIKLWQRDGTLLKTFAGQADFNQVAFSTDGQTLALASQDQTIQLWNWDGKQAALEKTLKTSSQQSSAFNSVAFSPNNQLIAAGSDDATIKIWQRDGTLLQTLKGHKSRILSIAFSPNSQLIASASQDGTVKIWRWHHQNQEATLEVTLRGHRGSVRDVAFSPDGQQIISGSRDRTINLWQVDGTLLLTLQGHRDQVTAVGFSPDGQFIISGSEDNSVRLWQPENYLLTTLFGHRNLVQTVDFSPDGQLIASGSADHTIKLWQPDGTLINTFPGFGDRIYDVDFSPDSQLIAAANGNKTVKLWQPDGTLVNTLKGHSDRVFGVTFSPDGQLIASASGDQTIKLWQPDGTLIHTLRGHKEEVNAVVFSPDGQLIVSGSGDNTIKIWQRDGTLLKTLDLLGGHKSTVFALDISSDGQLIVSGSGDNTVKLWNIHGELLTTLEDHTDSVMGVKFRPNSSIIASASVDQTIKLWHWDGQKANLKTTLMGHNGAVESIDFSPDGHALTSGSDDRTVILWNQHSILNIDDLLKHGCSWVKDYLNYNRAIPDSDRNLCDGIKFPLP